MRSLKFLLTVASASLILSSCNGCAKQKIVEAAMNRANDTNATIVTDLYVAAVQKSVDRACSDVRSAAASGDAPKAVAVIERLATEIDLLSQYRITYERNRWGRMGLVTQFIREQRSVFEVVAEDLEAADADVTAKHATTAAAK